MAKKQLSLNGCLDKGLGKALECSGGYRGLSHPALSVKLYSLCLHHLFLRMRGVRFGWHRWQRFLCLATLMNTATCHVSHPIVRFSHCRDIEPTTAHKTHWLSSSVASKGGLLTNAPTLPWNSSGCYPTRFRRIAWPFQSMWGDFALWISWPYAWFLRDREG